MTTEKTTVEVVWEDPPESDGRGRPPAAWLETLKANPDKWAKLPISGKGISSYRKRYGTEYEFTARSIEGESVAFGKFVGVVDNGKATKK